VHVHRVKERQIRNIIATEKSRSFAQFHPIIVLYPGYTQVAGYMIKVSSMVKIHKFSKFAAFR